MEKLHMQVSEIDSLPYYELEYTIEYYQEILEERNKEEQKQQKEQESKYNLGSYKNPAASLPKYKMPTAPQLRMPSMPHY